MKKISFVPVDAEVEKKVAMPKPAKLYLPDWYKGASSFFNYDNESYTNKLSFVEFGVPSTTMKTCMPFLDALSFGYIQETWCDIFIEYKNDKIYYHFADSVSKKNPIISTRRIETVANLPMPSDCIQDIFFHWSRVWNPIVPKGYSVLITHPFNREDLPFKSFSGVIDSDRYFSGGKVGFGLKKDFVGMIPKGTPMYQFIPFKKESWKISDIFLKNKILKKIDEQHYKTRSVFYGGYKKNYWNRKYFS